jgi:Family of unknown function (DUF6463)
MGTASIHTVVAVVQYHTVLASVLEKGVFNTVVGDPVIGAVVWSLLFGSVAFVGGLAVFHLERSQQPLPKSLGWCLLVLAVVGAGLVPVSGFWLLFPAAITILVRARSSRPISDDRSLS